MTDDGQTKTARRGRRHWASTRKPDIEHGGKALWRVTHERERLLLDFIYTESGPLGDWEIDVRHLPGYTDAGRFDFQSGNLAAAWRQYDARQQAHHAAIICRCIDDGIDMPGISKAAWDAEAVRDQKRRERIAALPYDPEMPF
jgi:hypothetical protein